MAKLLRLDTATINGVVQRMTARDLLVSTDDPNDRGRQTVALTRKGSTVVKAAIASARGNTDETVSRRTPTDENRLLHILPEMIGNEAAPAPGRIAKCQASRPRTGGPNGAGVRVEA